MSAFSTKFCISCDNLWHIDSLEDGQCVFCLYSIPENCFDICPLCDQEQALYYRPLVIESGIVKKYDTKLCCMCCHGINEIENKPSP